MKKIIILLLIAVVTAGCSSMDRTNPTDPDGTNYGGWHYVLGAGSFTGLSDFIYSNDRLLCLDVGDNRLYSYTLNGANEFFTDPVFSLPTGICATSGQLYILDQDPANEIKYMDITDLFDGGGIVIVTKDLSNGGDKITTDGNYLYVANDMPPQVYRYAISDFSTYTYISATAWAITMGTGPGQAMVISDIEYYSAAGSIIIADSSTTCISVYSTAGAWQRSFEVGSEIYGIAVDSNVIYVPTVDGLRRYNYSTFEALETVANYGEGNGKVTKAGLIDVSGRKWFIGYNDGIKYFDE